MIRQNEMKDAILLIAYGACGLQARNSLSAFADRVRGIYPSCSVRWAFSSDRLRERLARARQKTDSVSKALARLEHENFCRIAVQPLQTIAGMEYEQVCSEVAVAAARGGLNCAVGKPLLDSHADQVATADAILAHLPEQRLPGEDVVLMGHGARHRAVASYAALAEQVLARDGRVHVGTMNGAVMLDDILPRLVSARVWLLPLLSVIGRHAVADMAGAQRESWRSRIEAAGHTCCPVLRGMVENAGIAGIWLRHLDCAVQQLGIGTGRKGHPE